MATIIKINPQHEQTPASGHDSGHDSSVWSKKFAAGIDTDIFEADNLEFGGERFWESYWTTQHTYGAVTEGQSLAAMLAAQPDELLAKLQDDVSQLRGDHSKMSDSDKDDVLGMMMFLLSLERAQPGYNPFQALGMEQVLAGFAEAVASARQRRSL